MALATLPYPSMDFVPLDVLTADELDQIVANINAINNNSSVPTASIADGAVTVQKLASAVQDAYSYKAGDVVTFSNQILCCTIADSAGSQSYLLPVAKSLDRVSSATIRITSAVNSNFFRTIEDANYGFGRPTEGVDYAGTILGNGIGFTASLKTNTSNGHLAANQTGVAIIGAIRVTFA